MGALVFNCSKYFQNLLGLKLFDYKEKFFDNLDINLNEYFYKDSGKFPIKKPLLKEMLENDLKEYKLDFNFIQKYLINSLNKKVKALIDQFNNKIWNIFKLIFIFLFYIFEKIIFYLLLLFKIVLIYYYNNKK